MQIKSKNIKVAVALSGGVDSSVACALLKKQDFDVVGIFMNLWLAQGGCCSIEDQERARKVAEILKIPFYVVNFSDNFKNKVVEYFVNELKKGKTPNPCVVCNKEIKFGLLLKKAKELGCDYLATGHYASVRDHKLSTTNYKLMRSADRIKDQSYFLWRLSQEQLKYILFPIGEIESKQKVRDLAKKFGLPTYKTPESNDVCFLANTTQEKFLTATGLPQVGKIVDMGGNVLGQHNGLWFYTIGQRKGIALSQGPAFARLRRATAGKPWFVVGKDIKENTLVISQDTKDLLKKEVRFKNTNWISQQAKFPFKVKAKIRYGAELASCLVYKDKAIFTKPQRAITPGQSIVFYGKGNELLGGGIIQ